jgi:hypothetical protein
MAKNWFKHDCGEHRNSPSMRALRAKGGALLLGCYWYLIEEMHANDRGLITFDDIETALIEIGVTDAKAVIDELVRYKVICHDTERNVYTVQWVEDSVASRKQAIERNTLNAKRERLASDSLATGERLASDSLATGERLASDSLATGERLASDSLATGERLASDSLATRSTDNRVLDLRTKKKDHKNDLSLLSDFERNDGFDRFWDAYGKKRGRANALRQWQALKPADRAKALDTVAAYVASTPEVRYRKDPERWLRHRCFDDQIIITTTPTQSHGERTTITPDYYRRLAEGIQRVESDTDADADRELVPALAAATRIG